MAHRVKGVPGYQGLGSNLVAGISVLQPLWLTSLLSLQWTQMPMPRSGPESEPVSILCPTPLHSTQAPVILTRDDAGH